jgi:hypothetical protein
MIWDTSIWRLGYSNRSKIRSSQKCYLCLRYVVSLMCPGRTCRESRRLGKHPHSKPQVLHHPVERSPFDASRVTSITNFRFPNSRRAECLASSDLAPPSPDGSALLPPTLLPAFVCQVAGATNSKRLLYFFFQSLISAFYSYLSATIGSTDDALCAGMRQDKPEVATNSRITPASISPSSELP